MKNKLLSYDEVYRMVRQHCLLRFPQQADCHPQITVNAYLKNAGSSLHAPAPGLNFSHRTDDVISEFDRFIICDPDREALFADIADMVRWMAENDYLQSGRERESVYYPSDKLLRSPTLVF
ncbi:hypothetical protein [Pantoea sp. SM3]|uniref:hypothetical protein n=1 Tax=Pantoea sp. SM3 TaxID=1628192 RepID=UPI0005F81466|nr:hypothetical protein [Pantoea sp. SM3]KJV33104.1 hypothetical protein VI01_06660 [Pantoea sp. SM3]